MEKKKGVRWDPRGAGVSMYRAYRAAAHLVGFVQEPRGVLLGVVHAVQLEDERPARAYPRAPGEKVATDDSLEDAALAAGLAADDDDLG